MRVLFVDHEPKVLDAIRQQLQHDYEIQTALTGRDALQRLEETPEMAVVVSGLRMADMSGPELFATVRHKHPHCVRMILADQADAEVAIAAINEGNIYRFLTKPCAEACLRSALDAGIEQYQLTSSRRDLLEKTLQGLVETLTDILGLTNPMARYRTARIRQYVAAMAAAMHFALPWDLRLAALLSQLGCITLPGGILEKVYAGTALSPGEQELYGTHPAVAADLVARIPRLESVATMIRNQQNLDFRRFPADIAAWDSATTSLVILAVASRLDELLANGDQPAMALRRLMDWWPDIPQPVADAVRAVHRHSAYMDIRFVGFGELTPGMVLDEDVVTNAGDTLMFRGEEVTRRLLNQLLQPGQAIEEVADTVISQKLRVLIPA